MSAAVDVTTDRTEQHDWQDLVQSPGWGRLLAYARAEWEGPSFTNLVEQLADRPDDTAALSKLRQMIAAKRAVQKLLQAPEEQLAKLKRVEAYDPRNGPSLESIAGQMRRGRL